MPMFSSGGLTPRELARVSAMLDAMLFAADLENEPANRVTPERLASALARSAAGRAREVSCRVLSKEQLKEEGMGLVLAVGEGAGARAPPCMLVMELMSKGGHPAGRSQGRRTVVLVGKGVIFDSGGLSLKPISAMQGQHADKSGAAVVTTILGYFASAAADPLPFDVVALLPLVENAVSGGAMRPGDVVAACDGTTVEIVDPDAEGRMIMADAMAWSARYAPSMI